MKKAHKLIISFSLIIILIALFRYVAFPNQTLEERKTTVDKVDSAVATVLKSQVDSQKSSGPAEKVAKVEPSEVPWEELQERWNDELRNFTLSLDSIKGEKIYQDFMEEKKRYEAEDRLIREKSEAIWKQKPINKELQQKVFLESSDAIEKHRNNTEKIFGKHYKEAQKLSKEFQESIQVYSRDVPIGVDIAF